MEDCEVVKEAEEGLSTREQEVYGVCSVCWVGRTREDERRLPRVFIDKAGRTHVELARLRLGGGTTSAMTRTEGSTLRVSWQ